MRPRLQHAPLLLVIGLACGLAACGDTITQIICPLGTEPVGSECIPLGPGPVDTTVTPDTAPDAGPDTTDTNPFPVEDVTEDSGPDAGPDTTDIGQPDSPIAAGATGAACAKGSDCGGGTCLDFPGGYCTRFDCESTGCPTGSECMPLIGGNTACLATCDGDSACRPGGQQACKVLSDKDGTLLQVCHGVQAGAATVGGRCDDTVDCADDRACLPSIPGGYCASLGCSAGSCGSGSKCITFGGFPTCLKTCDSDGDCGGGPDAERRCGILKALDKTQVGACISGAEGQVVGQSCQNDFDCKSGTCQILGEGTCTQGGLPCFQGDPAGVCGAGVCNLAQNAVGTCTQPCSVGTACPGQSVCVGQPGPPEGWCRVRCIGEDDCDATTGFECTYGWPLGSTSGQPTGACRIAASATVGAACGEGQSCGGGTCEPLSAGTGSMCTTTCADDGYCPFPGICVVEGQTLTCRKACLSILHCEDGAKCEPAQGALGSVCR